MGCYGDGGALFTNDDALAAEMRAIANHGMVVRYHHDTVGVNSRLDSIQAAVLDVKLPHLNEYIASRQRAAAYYDQAFINHPNILIPVRDAKSTHVFHQYTLRLINVNRDTLRDALAEKGIPTMIYYPIPLHLQKAYQDPRYKAGDFPVAERLAACVLSLPMHTIPNLMVFDSSSFFPHAAKHRIIASASTTANTFFILFSPFLLSALSFK